jgi:pimeloyl-ACP methyl ester carboxylesterase
MKYFITLLALLAFNLASGQIIVPDLQNSDLWYVQDRNIAKGQDEEIIFDANPDDGLMVLKDFDFQNGTIEFDVKGEDKPGASFVGLAFNIQSETVFETVYFRPFNFRNEIRKTHAVQYTFHPVYTWKVLRENFPDKYENQLNPAPDPDMWFHVRITKNNGTVKAFVNGDSQASLIVESLSEIDHGLIGLWAGSNSIGSFKNLKITPAPERKYGYNAAVGKYFDVGRDTKLYYEVYGEGVPVLMLHGGVYGYIDEFEYFIDELSKNYQVICLATRGHVKSDIGDEPFTYDQRVSDAKKLLDHLGIQKTKVIGFSDGGYAGYKLAANYPEAVDRMVVIGAGDKPKGSGVNYGYSAEKLMAESGNYFRGRVEAMPEPDRWDESLQWLNALYESEVITEETFKKISAPTLLLAGEYDQYSNPQRILDASSMIKNSNLSIIPGCGHVVFYCNWNAVWAAVDPFFAKE